MVMGPTHAASGAAAGMLAALWLPPGIGGAESLGATVLYGGVAAGAALLPDFDHPSSTVSRSGGVLTGTLSRAVAIISLGFRDATASSKDKHVKDGHRGLTHTLLFAIIIGCLVWWSAPYRWPAAVVIGLCLWWAILGLAGRWADRNPLWAIGVPAMSAAVAAFWMPGLANPEGLAVATVIGLVAHCLGDALTISGDPIFAPIVPIAGRRWWNFRLPTSLTIEADGIGNTVLMVLFGAATVALPLLLSPPIAPYVYDSTHWQWLGRAATWAWW